MLLNNNTYSFIEYTTDSKLYGIENKIFSRTIIIGVRSFENVIVVTEISVPTYIMGKKNVKNIFSSHYNEIPTYLYNNKNKKRHGTTIIVQMKLLWCCVECLKIV